MAVKLTLKDTVSIFSEECHCTITLVEFRKDTWHIYFELKSDAKDSSELPDPNESSLIVREDYVEEFSPVDVTIEKKTEKEISGCLNFDTKLKKKATYCLRFGVGFTEVQLFFANKEFFNTYPVHHLLNTEKGFHELVDAVEAGDLSKVESLLESGADLEQTNSLSETALIKACQKDHLEIAKFLLEKEANADAQDDEYNYPIGIACSNNNIELVKLLLEYATYDASEDDDGKWETPLHIASKNGFMDIVKLLIEYEVDINATDDSYETALHKAAREGRTEVVKFLLENEADLTLEDSNEQTALHIACYEGHLEVSKLLIEHGADIHKPDGEGIFPLHLASQAGKLETVKLLVEKKADVNSEDGEQMTPLYYVCNGIGDEAIEVTKFLIDNGADINKPDNSSKTPLQVACENGYIETVKFFLEKKAQVNKQSDDGESALFLAAQYGYEEIVKILIENGADLETKRKEDSETPLITASRNAHNSIAKFLIEKGADVNARTYMQADALYHAHTNGSWDLEKIIVNRRATKNNEDLFFLAAVEGCASVVEEIIREKTGEPKLEKQVKKVEEKKEEAPKEPVKKTEPPAKQTQSVYKNAAPPKKVVQSSYKTPAPKQDNQPKPQAASVPQFTPAEKPMSQMEAVLKLKGITLNKLLGNGAFGEVWRGTLEEKPIAVKFLQKMTESSQKEVTNELSLLGNFQHWSIVAHEMFIPEIPAIVLELVGGGSMYDILKDQTAPIGWGLRIKWAMQISEALLAMHSRGIIHRDLRTPNILLTDDFDVKVSDFGVSMRARDKGKVQLPFYAHSDVYQVEEETTYDYPFDLRLFGIVLGKMLLFGQGIDSFELYDYKTGKITKSLPCSNSNYRMLLDFCFEPTSSATKSIALSRSVAAHFFGGKYKNSLPPSGEQISSLISAAQKKDMSKKYVAISALSRLEIKTEEVLKCFVGLTEDSEAEVRLSVASALATVEPVLLYPQLLLPVAVQPDEDLDENQEICDLEDFDDDAEEVVKQQLKLLEHKNHDQRLEAVDVIRSYLPTKETVAALRKCLKDGSNKVKLHAAMALASYGQKDEELLPILLEGLTKSNSEEEEIAESAVSLGLLGIQDKKVLLSLRKSLESESERVSYLSAIGLGLLGVKEERIITASIDSLLYNEDGDDWIRTGALKAIATFGIWNKKIKTALVDVLKNEEESDDVIVQAIKSIDKLGGNDEEVQVALVALLKHDEESVRTTASKLLGKLNK